MNDQEYFAKQSRIRLADLGIEPALDEQELQERRRLFLRVMRQPEMKLVRAALHQLKWDEDVDWRAMPELELFPYGYRCDCCMVLCGRYLLVCLDVNASSPYFHFSWLHQENDPACKCEYCVVQEVVL